MTEPASHHAEEPLASAVNVSEMQGTSSEESQADQPAASHQDGPISSTPRDSSWRRTFYTVMAGQGISLIGSSAVQFALIWHLTVTTGSASTLGLAGMVGFLPQALLSPIAGIVADRYNRKIICILSDLAVGILAVVLAIIMGVAGTSTEVIIAVLALRSALGAFQGPAMQAMTPQYVPADELVRAGGISQMIMSASFLLGPVAGAALYGALPLNVVLATDLVGALAASGALLLVSIPSHRAKASAEMPRPQNPLLELKEGLAVYWEDPSLSVVAAAFILFSILFMPLSSYYPLMTGAHFDLGSAEAGIVEMSWAAGMFIAGGVISQIRIKREVRFALFSLVVLGAVTAASGLLPPTYTGWLVFVALCAVMGAAGNGFNTPLMAYLQRTIDPMKMGRAFSAFQMISTVTMPLGLLIASPIAEELGVDAWFLIAGAAIALVGAGAFVAESAVARKAVA
ncbi:MFS transporter [Collinsella vaginalis]|uniref:MFS transporter n=1 Tax=Collinsella vaginalis TaxID=1870987 RepID=UPI000A26C854|nr:MFS transporter [Collinsella vaginalis]